MVTMNGYQCITLNGTLNERMITIQWYQCMQRNQAYLYLIFTGNISNISGADVRPANVEETRTQRTSYIKLRNIQIIQYSQMLHKYTNLIVFEGTE